MHWQWQRDENRPWRMGFWTGVSETLRHPKSWGRKTLVIALPALTVCIMLAWGVYSAYAAQQRATNPSPTTPASAVSAAADAMQNLESWSIKLSGKSTLQTATFDGQFKPGQVFFVPEGAEFRVQALPEGATGQFTLAGSLFERGGGTQSLSTDGDRLSLRAPTRPGAFTLRWSNGGVLEVVVLDTAELKREKDRTRAMVDGKSIGYYLDPGDAPTKQVKDHAERYVPPVFFAKLDERTANLPIGEDLLLGQLVAFKERYEADGHKTILPEKHTDELPVNRDLLTKLVKLRERLREKGVKVTRFWITSGFRTPDYNKHIGGATYSRHCYGDAVDLCIDEDHDLKMDDLNGDGKIDRNDGLLIAEACADLEKEGAVVPGGIGVYEWDGEFSVRCHVHIDCRGYKVRWSQAYQGGRKVSFNWWTKRGEKDVEGLEGGD